MNETQKLIKYKSENRNVIYKNNSSNNKENAILNNNIIKILHKYYRELLLIILIIISFVILNNKIYINNSKNTIENEIKNIENENNDLENENNDNIKNEVYFRENENVNNNKNKKPTNFIPDCKTLDPINIFKLRIEKDEIEICKNVNSSHFCYQNTNNFINDDLWYNDGVICKMENIIINPSKLKKTNYIYKGPIDQKNFGFPLLSNGFFNMNCRNLYPLERFNTIYDYYFDSWNYDYKNQNEKIEELAPGKTILFISRNQDSPNLFHGNSEIINVISMMDIFNLKPEKIQVIFIESIQIKNDPFYDIYKDLISRGGKPLYIKNLKKKYYISSAIHVPINWDSPCFFKSFDYPKCLYPTKTYKLYNDLIDKYFNIPDFNDSFVSDSIIFYYPKSVINNYKKNIKFKKNITIQWRKVWPKGRKKQNRLLGNGPILADKLASILPNNFLIRLVDTASMSMREQISIMKKTDYLVGIHGAGLSLSIFLPNKSILHEILPSYNLKVLTMMSALSGHTTYSDIIDSKTKKIGGYEYIFFNTTDFGEKVKIHMKENDYF